MIAPFEELYRDDGYRALHAAKLAINRRNASGGIAGHSVALLALNDNGRAEEATLQARKLAVDRDVLGVIGPIQLHTAVAAGSELGAHGLPWIVPVSIETKDLGNGFGLAAGPEELGERAVTFLVEKGVDDRIVIFSDQPTAFAGARRAAAMSGIDLLEMPLDVEAPAPAGQGYVWLNGAEDGARLAEQISSDILANSPLIGSQGIGSSVFPARADSAAAGTWWMSSGPGRGQLDPAFIKAYRELAGMDPGPQEALIYDAANLYLDAIERTVEQRDSLTRESVREAILALGQQGWQGVSGQVSWQACDCGSDVPCWRWQDAPLNLFPVESGIAVED
ncbi:MAG: ABC transporter substrate-binding protein [Chloroflexota bacterium]|nr:ABC transporter substrate-binding protein [Chloroflexota bacterium]